MLHRVVRTEFYLDAEDFRPSYGMTYLAFPDSSSFQDRDAVPSFSAAWLRNFKPRDFPGDSGDLRSKSSPFIGIDSVEWYLFQVLVNGRYSGEERGVLFDTNHPLVDRILAQPIVLEQSPVLTEPFYSILRRSTPSVAIGAYVGYAAANGNYLLMVTVPAGILLVGSAIEITRALPRILSGKKAPRGRPRNSQPTRKRNPP